MRGGGGALEPGGDNALAMAFGVLGDEWNLWILGKALQGTRRYRDWLSSGEISNSVLTGRLARLVEVGLLEKVAFPRESIRAEYLLTDCGRAVWSVLATMWSWERRWAPDGRAGLLRMQHVACGAEFTPIMACARCREPAGFEDVATRVGPSGGSRRSIPAASGRRRSGGTRRPSHLPHTMELLGNRWSVALLGAASFGATRFGEFCEWTGASSAIVADRLRSFTELGVMSECPVPKRADRVTYHLTGKGQDFFPVVMHMIEWGQWWFRAPEGGAVLAHHGPCAGSFSARLVCSECSGLLQAREISIESPGLSSEADDDWLSGPGRAGVTVRGKSSDLDHTAN
ncbi:DNA-binding HxlR family transcriptional regulator [Rhodococcus sp. LBL1]|nr:DNA-binding HxlR family transcriptional regulator [Rhodococcus sp. LBL1]MDH6682178.1 DNA-binding HxlR family transcriptional regulator [Rhodococcus sp. LBL2]